MPTLDEKYGLLKKILAGYDTIGIAFSGGVDSTLLLKVAHDVLGDNAVALTASMRSFPASEQREAASFCKSVGIKQVVCEIDEMEVPDFVQNTPERCYYCKKNILAKLRGAAEKLGVSNIAEGSNVSDLSDYRPGRRAVEESGAVSPLLVAGLDKQDIRALSARLNLPTWNKPSYACLASRIASGEPITKEKLRMAEKAEAFLLEKGIRKTRVRIHGDLARIEVEPENISRLAQADFREELAIKLQELGFRYVSLDLIGYKTGNMNPKGV